MDPRGDQKPSMEKTTAMATATTPARRTVGEYMLGERIGSGSFSVVWRGWHLRTGQDVAVKEIEKGNLNPKVRDNLIKEITILHEVSHSNIVRFHEAIQTVDKIYLVLEYCAGGDLAAYILRHGRVDDGVARHFMRQLASGLECLWENNLIHRDLKPQNLLLSTKEDTLVLKIADFGFARYLLPQGLADTHCGSPLYMAPEIIQNKKYDAKADLWSVGAILFQLVTGKPPFNGNNQFQLFQNILSSNELQFPQEVFVDLSSDCVDLCRSLLRHDPVERLSFDGFFSHRFLTVPRMSESTPEIMQNTADDNLGVIDGDSSDSLHVWSLKIGSMDQGLLNTNAAKVSASLESIEREYVLVDAHSASMDLLPSSLEISFRDSFTTRPSYVQNEVWKDTAGPRYIGEIASSSVSMLKSRGGHVSTPLSTSRPTISLREVHGTMSSHPSRRLQSLFSYVEALTELAQEKLQVGSHLESFSIELVILALWKEALRVCNFWIKTSTPAVAASTSDYPKIDHSSVELEPMVDFRTPSSACSLAEIEFLIAYDRAEKISNNFREIDGSMMMPDAMEIIYQTALSAGKSGGVNQLLGDRSTAVASYSRAITLLTFIMAEAPSLPVRPPFSLSMDDQRRISRYITSLRHLKQDQST